MLLKFSVVFVFLDIFCVCHGFLPGKYDILESSMLEAECGSMELDCRDLTNAVLCDRVQACIDAQWADTTPPSDQSDTCDSCRSMVIDAQVGMRGQNDGYMISVITDSLYQVCALKEFGYVKCIEYVDKFVPAFITLMTSELSSHQICYLFLECNGDVSSMTSGDSYVPTDDDNEYGDDVHDLGHFDIPTSIDVDYSCDECKTFALEITKSVKKMGKNAFVSRFKGLCKQVKIPFCDVVVNKGAPNLYDWLIRGPTKQLCQYFGMCNQGMSEIDDDSSEEVDKVKKDEMSSDESDESSEEKDISIPPGASPLCPLCEFAMEELQKQLADKQTEEEIKQSIEHLCSYLPSTVSSECNYFIDKYGDRIFQLVLQELNTSNVCALLNICSAIDGFESGSVCTVCHHQMRLVHLLLNMDHVKDLIELEMQGVCDLLPSVWHATCVEFVDMYLGDLLSQLKDMDLTVICDHMDICRVHPGFEMSIDIEKRSLNLASANKCQACVTVLRNVKKYAVLITKSMDFVCYLFPLYTDMCKLMVDQFGPLIVKMIIAAVQPEMICRAIHLCPTAVEDMQLKQWNLPSLDDW